MIKCEMIHASLEESVEASLMTQGEFCRTLCLGQVPLWDGKDQWMSVCYHIFPSLLRDRLPHMSLDPELATYAEAKLKRIPAEAFR